LPYGVGGVRTVVITGASTGIGNATARRLHRDGFRVFAGARKPQDAERLRAEGVEPLEVDITDETAIAAAARRVGEETEDLAGLVNNAGVAVGSPFEVVDLDGLRHQLEVNFVGHVAVTQAFLPLLRRARGRVVNVGSVGGRMALPFNGPYHASKYAMEAFTDSLRAELRPWGMRVVVVEPGTIDTPIWESAKGLIEDMSPEGRELYGERMGKAEAFVAELTRHAIPPEKVADVIAEALTTRRPRPRYVVGRDARAQLVLKALLPTRVLDAAIARRLG
jgi:NAD(P)-dependent dehydrogenase (short-subunit alcohol dehydrogenase family)